MSVSSPSQSPPFELAKQALAMVGEHQTPPTPKVFEVWYRYAEGSIGPITEQLDHVLQEGSEVTVELLTQLHEQFCSTQDDANDRVSYALGKELLSLQKLILAQLSAGQTFSSSINTANSVIDTESQMSPAEIARGIEQLLVSNQTMQSQLNEMGSRLRQSQGQVDSLRKDLIDSHKSMLTDPLTGAGNRRFFDNLLSRLAAERQEDSNVFLMLIDLDDFKGINDQFGHAAGDQVLRFVSAETVKLRPEISLARYGGDEFALFMDSCSTEEATDFADQVRRFFSSNSLRLARSKESLGRISLSIGVARLRPDDCADSWFERADGLLYRAKESGRNCVMVERSID
ncbi:MAG: diguanylate cyclase [Planctomycetota bacterium]